MSGATPTDMGSPRSPSRWVRDNSLSLAFTVLFVLCVVGQAVVGLALYNEQARGAGLSQVSLARYVTSSHFAVDLAENWQSEYLQFTLYILLTVWFVQRGSSESKKPADIGRESDEKQRVGAFARPDSPAWVRQGGWRTRVYSHSLVAVMLAVFVLSWATQAIAGRVADNETRIADAIAPQTLGQYVLSPDFWSRTLQNWQSEMLAIASMAVFAVYLRERGSPESKPVGAPHDETTSAD